MNRYPPASPVPSIFPRRDIFREVDYPDHVFWGFKWECRLGPKQNSSLMAVAKNRRKLLSILGTTIRCSLLENQNQSELFETITELEAIFHGAT